jgi:hypothetical protein
MKKFLHSRDGASRGAALIIVLAFVVIATALSLTYLTRTTTGQLAQSSLNDTTADLVARTALDIFHRALPSMEIPKPFEFTRERGYHPSPPRWHVFPSALANAINTGDGITARNISIDLHQDKGTIARAMVTSPDTGCSFIASAPIFNSGNFYMVGDKLDPVSGTLCDPADNYGFRLQVVSVASPGPGCVTGGCVTGVTIIAGIGYSNAPSNPVAFVGSATGSGFTANCTFQQQ